MQRWSILRALALVLAGAVAASCGRVERTDDDADVRAEPDAGQPDGATIDAARIPCANDSACDDGILCTVDSCSNGGCLHTPSDSFCSDSVACNGIERCAPHTIGATSSGCTAGAPAACPSDGIDCTVESCIEPDGCTSLPNDSLCPCGLSCVAELGGCARGLFPRLCGGATTACGDGMDNDGDGLIDMADPECTTPCQYDEASFSLRIPACDRQPCIQDCYFDMNGGQGDDRCNWTHRCDPLSVAPRFDPEGPACAYDPTGRACDELAASQPQTCLDRCIPFVPNGCDCFGCCQVPGAATPIWIGSVQPTSGVGCSLAQVADRDICRPCTIVSACFNPCERCEVCLGKSTIPADCGSTQTCPSGSPCGVGCQRECPADQYCLSGCCTKSPG